VTITGGHLLGNIIADGSIGTIALLKGADDSSATSAFLRR